MSIETIAQTLVEKCRTGANLDVVNELYHDDIVSVEPDYSPAPLTSGKAAVIAKEEAFFGDVEAVHSNEVSNPIIAGNHFSVTMKMEFTSKTYGRTAMEEIAVYEVKDGKIIREQFFYPAPTQA